MSFGACRLCRLEPIVCVICLIAGHGGCIQCSSARTRGVGVTDKSGNSVVPNLSEANACKNKICVFSKFIKIYCCF